MNSIGENCNEMKKAYDACFNAWFSEKFLHGGNDDSACAPLFKTYQQCVKVRYNISIRIHYNIYLISTSFHVFQEAMKEHNIEFREIEGDYLGSDREYQSPNGAKTEGSS